MHDNQVSMDHHDVITRVYTEEVITAFREQMREVDRLADELNNLLVNYKTMIEREGATDQIETLVRWAESYHSGLSTAGRITRDGQTLLRDLTSKTHTEKHEISEEKKQPALKQFHKTRSKYVESAVRKFGKMKIMFPWEQAFNSFPTRSVRVR